MATDIHLVNGLGEAFEIMHEIGAEAVGLDIEGLVGNYVGNEPYPGRLEDFQWGYGAANLTLTRDTVSANEGIQFATMTNNTNVGDPTIGEPGIVSWVADELNVAAIYKGMQVGATTLGKKPSGDQGRHLTEITGVAPEKTVLIDDQGVKNTGEAVEAGFGAIIVPYPIGLPMGRGIHEHRWVGRARFIEPAIYRSLAQKGNLAMAAFEILAKTNIADLGKLYDHRT